MRLAREHHAGGAGAATAAGNAKQYGSTPARF